MAIETVVTTKYNITENGDFFDVEVQKDWNNSINIKQRNNGPENYGEIYLKIVLIDELIEVLNKIKDGVDK